MLPSQKQKLSTERPEAFPVPPLRTSGRPINEVSNNASNLQAYRRDMGEENHGSHPPDEFHFLYPMPQQFISPGGSANAKAESAIAPVAEVPKHSAPHAPVDLQPGPVPQTAGTDAGEGVARAEKSRIYIACVECRTRKVRCDGQKPSCEGCKRRRSSCQYDMEPKRRGPDKNPGQRQRAPKGSTSQAIRSKSSSAGSTEPILQKRTRDSSQDGHVVAPEPDLTFTFDRREPASTIPKRRRKDHQPSGALPFGYTSPTSSSSQLTIAPTHSTPPASSSRKSVSTGLGFPPAFTQPTSSSSAFTDSADVVPSISEILAAGTSDTDIVREPSLNFARENWWDSVLYIYGPDRQMAVREIQDDFAHLFRTSGVFLSFINVPLFYASLYNPHTRMDVQPALILALLGYSVLTQSSEIERGAPGRAKSIKLLENAHSAFAASYNSGWIDTTLAQAAWAITQFEFSAHPYYSFARSLSSCQLLDNVLHVLRLPCLDADNPAAPVFIKNSVPALPRSQMHLPCIPARPSSALHPSSSGDPLANPPSIRISRHIPSHDTQPTVESSQQLNRTECPCSSFSLANSPEAHRTTPLWLTAPNWDPAWTLAEIRREESRRLVWSSLTLVSGLMAARLGGELPLPDLYVTKSENYALLFPGEVLYPGSSSGHSGKESTWALSSRAMLLWNTCIRVQKEPALSSDEKADFAARAWLETLAIEEALDEHTCDGERSLLYFSRETLLNIRMFISYEYRRTIPLPKTGINFAQFNRNKAIQLLTLQKEIASHMAAGPSFALGQTYVLIAKRPFYIWWFIGQAARFLRLWRSDPSLVVALDVAIGFLPLMDYLTAIYPCPVQQKVMDLLRTGLTTAAKYAGRPPPPPQNLSINPSLGSG